MLRINKGQTHILQLILTKLLQQLTFLIEAAAEIEENFQHFFVLVRQDITRWVAH